MAGGIKARDRRAIRPESPPPFAPVRVMRSQRIPSEDKITRDNQKVAQSPSAERAPGVADGHLLST